MNEVTQTVVLDFISAEDFNKRERARYMAMNARTSIMMYKATKDKKYLVQARNEIEIGKIVRSRGMITMKEDAIIKSMNQRIPFEEVNML